MSTAGVTVLSLSIFLSILMFSSLWFGPLFWALRGKIKTLWWKAGDKWLDPAGSRGVFFLYNNNFYRKEMLRD
jgi:hypothetical protein